MAPDNRTPSSQVAYQLPELVTSQADVGRLLRELEAIDDTLLSQTLRKNAAETKMLKTSRLMDQTVELNKLNLLQQADRRQLRVFLAAVRQHAPVLHMSFSADPSPAFVGKLMAWLRREIHPLVLLNIGLQPSIGAGCVVRSTNRYFDFSLRQDFAKKRNLLLKELIPLPQEASHERQ